MSPQTLPDLPDISQDPWVDAEKKASEPGLTGR